MKAAQFGITKKNQSQQHPKKVTKQAYRAINGEMFAGRQVYLDAKDQRGYFAVGTNAFVFITATRYHAIAGELFGGRQTYWSPTGKKGFFDAGSNEFRPATALEKQRRAGQFARPLYAVKTDRRPTGHQPSNGKKNGEKQKKVA